MKTKTIFITTASALLLSICLTGCGCDHKNSTCSTAASAPDSEEISNVKFDMTIKLTQRNYSITSDAYNCTLSLSAIIDWPENINGRNIDNLQHHITDAVNDSVHYTTIDDAIIAYTGTPDRYGIDGKITELDSVPSALTPTNYEAWLKIRLLSADGDLITYDVARYSYLGGAHPIYTSTPFTFNLNANTVIDNNWLFDKGYMDSLMPTLTDAFAAQVRMTPQQIEKTMLTKTFPVSENVYIQNGYIVFHYNPYDVLPYSYGSVDVTIDPYSVKDLLTPQAKALLLR